MFYRRFLTPHFIWEAAYFFRCLLPVHIFCFEPGLCHICFCLASYVIFGLGISFTLCFHFTIWVYNPFWPSPNLGESVQCTRYYDKALAYCSVLCSFSTLVCCTWRFLWLPALSLFWFAMIFLIHVCTTSILAMVYNWYLWCSSEHSRISIS